jgi:LAS superfamily LD-carboxypeptidase LdcB
MNKGNIKYIFILIILPILLISSFLSDFNKKKVEEANYQKFLTNQQIKNEEKKIYLMGKFEPEQRKDFTLVPSEYNANGYKMYLRKEALTAFSKMAEAAKKDVIELKIVSATRNFNYQKSLWNNKWTGVTIVNGQNLFKSISSGIERFKKILEYSAVPGMSRHHWGSDLDINNVNPSYFNLNKGEKEYMWLVKNASLFGFCQPYTLKGTARPTGYNEEKWHWSYLPLAKAFTEQYKDLIKEEDINGFLGDENVLGQDLINNYVLGINPDCI